MHRSALVAVPLAAVLLAAAAPARAELQDEIQVYDDSIDAPGERGLELHVNTTPKGRSAPAYPGEATPHHGWRLTPELSYGLSRDLEAGLYLPTERSADGSYSLAGAKLRLKWLPLQTNGGRGWFGGVNVELSRLARRYSESRTSAEVRFIGGWRGDAWWVAVNPLLDFGLSDGHRGDRPELGLAVKVARRVAAGTAVGVEYYHHAGALGRRLPWQEQDNRLYLALDVDRGGWGFNLGLGRGLTDAADRWTVKAIVELPLPGSAH